MKGLNRQDIARIAAEDIPEGLCVNLGIGLPTMIADYIPLGREVLLHSEQGLMGLGPAPAAGQEDSDIVNAGKLPVTLLKGASIFSHSDSFLMIRGGHIDIACLGAFQVAENGDLANWSTGLSTETPGVGGAMDLAAGAANVWVLMEHCQKDGTPRLLERCTYPLTGHKCVTRIYTNYALIEICSTGFVVERIANDIDFETLQKITGAPLQLSPQCAPYLPGVARDTGTHHA
ncbi:MAG: 3-oxoadipate CoA-transferase [Alcaligenaceae bacterium]|nr:MAG: 3-oxoadipate CoA-transferase [Alcaligenaceae bacterium]